MTCIIPSSSIKSGRNGSSIELLNIFDARFFAEYEIFYEILSEQERELLRVISLSITI